MLARKLEEGGEVQRVAQHLPGVLVFGDQRLRGGVGAEEGLAQLLLGGAQLVEEVLVLGQLHEHLEQHRDVLWARLSDDRRTGGGRRVGAGGGGQRSGRSG